MGYSLHKIGLARPALKHQRIARNIVINFYNEVGFNEFEAFQEGLANPDDSSGLVPDAVFMNCDNNKIEVAIEVSTNTQINTPYFQGKIKMLTDNYSLKELFVYNYQTNEWFCYGKDIDPDEPSYSPLLDVDFADLIELN